MKSAAHCVVSGNVFAVGMDRSERAIASTLMHVLFSLVARSRFLLILWRSTSVREMKITVESSLETSPPDSITASEPNSSDWKIILSGITVEASTVSSKVKMSSSEVRLKLNSTRYGGVMSLMYPPGRTLNAELLEIVTTSSLDVSWMKSGEIEM